MVAKNEKMYKNFIINRSNMGEFARMYLRITEKGALQLAVVGNSTRK